MSSVLEVLCVKTNGECIFFMIKLAGTSFKLHRQAVNGKTARRKHPCAGSFTVKYPGMSFPVWRLLLFLLSLIYRESTRRIYKVDYSACLSKLLNHLSSCASWNHPSSSAAELRRPCVWMSEGTVGNLQQGVKFFFHFQPACFHRNINYASTRIPVNIGVKSYEGCPKTEAQGGIGGEKLAVPEETWPRCGSACNAWARMHPNFSLWLLIRNWWWNAPRNGKLFFIIIVVLRVLTVVQLLKTHEKCVCVCVYAGMLSSFMVTHTKSC